MIIRPSLWTPPPSWAPPVLRGRVPPLPWDARVPRHIRDPRADEAIRQCAIARVNSATGSVDANGTTIAAGAQTHTTGNALIVWVKWEDTTTTLASVVDTAGNSYSVLTQPTPDGVHGAFSYALNITGHASNIVTVTLANAAPWKAIVVVQYSGLATSSAFDQQNTGSSLGAAGTLTSSGSITTTQNDEVLVVGVGAYGSVTATPGANWTEVYDPNAPIKFYERIVSATGTYSVVANTTDANKIQLSGNQNWITSLASFKAAVGGGGGRTTKNTRAWGLGMDLGTNLWGAA